MQNHARIFYLYLGMHSLLIGIFPFFMPVYLWNEGYGLGELSIFIGLAGLGFCLGLWAWDRLRLHIDLPSLIALSLLFEMLMLLNVYLLEMGKSTLGVVALALCYGVYNCFFWTTQRALFFDIIEPDNSGRQYGNFQIFVGALLQVGILLGGLFLERDSFLFIVMVSGVVAVSGFMLLLVNKPRYPVTLARTAAVRVREILKFTDKDRSKLIFIVDGFYLFLESFFWVVSLFLIARESFTTLGIMVLSLAVIFGILFYLLKNTIDRLDRRPLYQLAVVLYAISWLLRTAADEHLSLELLFVLLVLITFATSMFRLVMNKRFYDIAKASLAHRYLVLKSYYSQATIFVLFLAFGGALLHFGRGEEILTPVYWMAAAGALIYFCYGAKRYR